MVHLRRLAATTAATLALLISACGDDSPDTSTPARAYETFFVEMNRGNRDTALEVLAPAGALGDTFRGGAYYTYADSVEESLNRHGGLEEVIIDNEGEINEEAVRVEGSLRFQDGTEMKRAITFERENGSWVGQL
ncbi:hypothetical protein [Aquisalimonas sp.]|uniref:hypothetical protein n=1 Tax=Aquisalimonas sp. TaxID=1872621 RepID=UPI0025BDEC47|nr:hypothetical protein [Aquisalimonas sp.]